jgi:hypothetical protein
MGVVTIEMKTSFMRPAKVTPGGRLTAKGRLMHRTKSMAFTEGTIYDEAGLACAHATGTFKYVNRAPDRATEAGAPRSPADFNRLKTGNRDQIGTIPASNGHHQLSKTYQPRNFHAPEQTILLDNRPEGEAVAANFRLVTTDTPRCRTARCWCATIS